MCITHAHLGVLTDEYLKGVARAWAYVLMNLLRSNMARAWAYVLMNLLRSNMMGKGL